MKLQFKPFYLSEEILRKYCKWFGNKRFERILFEGTPKTKEQVKAWVMDCVEGNSKRYFFVVKDNAIIGHIGLRAINFEFKHSDIGSFFIDSRHRYGAVMEESLKFIIEQAKKRKITLLTADFTDEFQQQMKAFINIGFTPNPLAPHYLTLQLS